MWMAMGVGILLVAQAGASPAVVAPNGPSSPATNAPDNAEAPAVESPASGTETTLRFRNDVGDAFQLTEARFTLDGRDLPAVLTSAARGEGYVIFAGPLSPGRHVLTAHVSYQGKSRSVFTYMKGYTFNLDSSHELEVATSGSTSATIVGKPNKGFNVPFEKSLTVGLEQVNGSAAASTNEASSGYRPPR